MIILQYHEIPEIELPKDSNNRKYDGILLIRRTCTGCLTDRWFYFYFLYECLFLCSYDKNSFKCY